MKDQLKKAQRAPQQGYLSVKDNVETVVPLVRRVMEDRRTREALRALVAAGRDVRDELRHDGGRALVNDRRRRGHVTQDIEGSAKVLRAAAAEMSKARSRERRARSVRLAGVVALLTGIVFALKRRVTPERGWHNDRAPDASGDWPAHGSATSSDPTKSAGSPLGTV